MPSLPNHLRLVSRPTDRSPGPSAAGDESELWASLVSRSREGDAEAFNRIVLGWQKRIFNLCLRMLASPEEAADATQEIFLKAFRTLNRLREASRFAPWIFQIAGNECRSRMRWRAVRRQTVSTPPDEMAERFEAPENPEAEAVAGDRERRVRGLLARLPLEERLVVELKFFQERTFQEISEISSTHLSTVKSRFYRGLEKLREDWTATTARKT